MLFDRIRVITASGLLFFFFYFISIYSVLAINTEGIPPIINYDSKDYNGSNKVYQIIQDTNQIIFASTTNNIIVFDGNHWQSIPVNGNPCFDLHNGEIYVGAYNDFGKIQFIENKGYAFVSLNNPENNLGQVNSIYSFQNKVYVATSRDVFVYSNKELELVESYDEPVSLYCSGKNLYLLITNAGLFKLKNNQFVEANGGRFFTQKEIVNILDFEKVEYIVTRNSGVYYYDENLFYVLPESKDLLLQNNICCAAKAENKIVIGTHKKGIFLLDDKGHLRESHPFESGLYSSEINHIFIDKNSDFWLSTNYGMSLMEQSASVVYFNEYNGLTGAINDILEFEGLLYIATSQGLYTYIESLKELSVFSEIELYTYNLFEFKNELYCSTEKGVFKKKGNTWNLFYDAVWLLARESKTNDGVLLVANQNGFFIYKTFNKQLYRLFSLSSITKDINSIAEDENSIWVGTNYNGVYKIEYKNTFDSIVDIQQYRNLNEQYLQWVKVESINNKTNFLTKNGVFYYDYKGNEFKANSTFKNNLSDVFEYIDPVIAFNNKIWFASYQNDNVLCKIGYQQYDSAGDFIETQFLRILKNNSVLELYPTSNKLWVATEKDILFFQNTDYRKTQETKTFFTQIAFDNDSLLNLNPSVQSIIDVPKGIRNINLTATSTNYANAQDVRYQYKIDGYDNDWTAWSDQNYVHYANLPRGKFQVFVRSKDLNNNISNVSSIHFVIQPPFYKSFFAYILYFLIVLSGFILIIKWRAYNFAIERFKLEETINKRTKELILQREKTEELLKSYAPKETIEKLHDFRKDKAQRYKMVTILFADIIGFSAIADQESSTEIIDELDKFYFQFDQVVERLNIKKIKTVGDTYMCAGGIPKKNRTNPIEVVLAAFEMQQYLQGLIKSNRFKEIKLWDIRFGIHTGPVFAEENPRKKHPYDIWGETVNIASRMQSSGEIGRVNISGNTYELIREYFICQYRGKMPVKYRGDLDMYFIEGFRPKLSVDQKGIVPNNAFRTKLALIRYDDLEEFVLNKLERELPNNMYYHNLKHTIDVIVQVELIGRSEGISDEELLLLKTAALFHDAGFTRGYQDHELLGLKMAKEILPHYDYTEEQIKQIEDLIFVTKLPPEPKNKMEEIMCDADLDYLGRVDFIPVSQMLFKELVVHGKIEDNLDKWNKLQIKFIENHQYFTETAKSLRDVNKKKQLDSIRKLVNSN